MANSDVQVIDEIYEAGREHGDMALQKARESEQVNRIIGGIQIAEYFQNHAKLAMGLMLHKVKKDQIYKSIGTWEDFCREVNIPRRTADLILDDLRPLTESVSARLAGFADADINLFRRLGKAVSANLAEINDDTVIINGKTIPFSKEHKEDIEDAVNELIRVRKEEAEKEKAEREKMKNRLKRLENRIDKEVEEETKTLSSERDALVKEIERLKSMIPEDLKFEAEDPVEQIEELRKKAELMAASCMVMAARPDERIARSRVLQGKVTGIFNTVESIFYDMRRSFETAFGMSEE